MSPCALIGEGGLLDLAPLSRSHPGVGDRCWPQVGVGPAQDLVVAAPSFSRATKPVITLRVEASVEQRGHDLVDLPRYPASRSRPESRSTRGALRLDPGGGALERSTR